MQRKGSASVASEFRGLFLLIGILSLLLILQFHRSFLPGETLRLNDGPLAAQLAHQGEFPGAFQGIWQDLNRVGAHGGSATLDLTFLMRWLLGPIGFTKFHAPLSILILGACAWMGLRALGFGEAVCVLGALGAALNSNFFSNACWGLASRPLTLAMMFLAVGAWVTPRVPHRWMRVALSGFAIGLGVTESADVGVIFSLVFAGFVVMRAWSEGASATGWRRLIRGLGATAAVALVAGLASIHLLTALLEAGINPARTAGTRFESEQQHWDWATQWSLPKSEVPRVFVAGLHGYLMGTEDGRDYWGAAGRSPDWQPGEMAGARYSGAGEYAGIVVCLVSVFGLIGSWRREGNPFSLSERRLMWFWCGTALVALAFALGRHAPFYRLLVSLPYFSSSRNPIKWMHGFHFAVLMMFAFGLEALARSYLRQVSKGLGSVPRPGLVSLGEPAFRTLGKRLAGATAVVAVGAAIAYSVSRPGLQAYLAGQGFKPHQIPQIAATSIREVWISVALLGAGLVTLAGIVSGKFAGPRARWGWGLLLVLTLCDLARANAPWIVHYNYEQRHAANPLWQKLSEGPMPQRVTIAPLRHPELGALEWIQSVYQAEWLQHQFPLFNIPSLDVIQDPRPAPDFQVYAASLSGNLARFWELTSTRFVLGLADPFAGLLNRLIDPERQRFHTLAHFDVVPNPAAGFPPVLRPDGAFGLVEFQGAMPRANLFGRWSVIEDSQVLQELVSPQFDPTHLVLVASATPVPQPPVEELASRSNLVVKAYSPKRVEMESEADGPTVLMLNDRYHSDWKVWVDGVAAPLLRCNYLMRGVQIPRGQHLIEFRFEPSRVGLSVSLAMLVLILTLVACQFGRPGLVTRGSRLSALA